MIVSLSFIILVTLLLSAIFKKLHLPTIIAMILAGILLGPQLLNVVDDSILSISTELRQIALVVILLRAGMSIDLSDLKQVGKRAVLMSFLPPLTEMILVTLFAVFVMKWSVLDSAILGSILAAVSLAVVVPKTIEMAQDKKGVAKRIPQMILAASSIDNVFVIVVFSILISTSSSGSTNWIGLINIPFSIILGILLGLCIGLFFVYLFKKIHVRDTVKVLVFMAMSFLVISIQNWLADIVSISGYLAILVIGSVLLAKYPVLAKRMTDKFGKVWVGAEIMLFVLIGCALDLSQVVQILWLGLGLITLSMFFRILVVWMIQRRSNLDKQELRFVISSTIPKATMQAAIGAIPLSMGLSSGQSILGIAVFAILLTAPIGAILMEIHEKKMIPDTK